MGILQVDGDSGVPCEDFFKKLPFGLRLEVRRSLDPQLKRYITRLLHSLNLLISGTLGLDQCPQNPRSYTDALNLLGFGV